MAPRNYYTKALCQCKYFAIRSELTLKKNSPNQSRAFNVELRLSTTYLELSSG